MKRHAELRTVQTDDVGFSPPAEGDAKLEVNVVFTTYPSTVAALRSACELARHLDARIRLIVVQSVPLAWSLESPPVSLDFVEERCRGMVAQCVEVCEVKIDLYMCWDKWQALREALTPRSLVIVGGRRRWWHSREQKLAKRLEAERHRVIFAEVRRCHDSVTAKIGV